MKIHANRKYTKIQSSMQSEGKLRMTRVNTEERIRQNILTVNSGFEFYNLFILCPEASK